MSAAAPWEDDARREEAAAALFRSFLRDNREELLLVARHGDGRCGWLIYVMKSELLGDAALVPPPKPAQKQVISRSLWKQVMERDGYRCRHCGGWHDLCCDHVVPESQGGPTTLENLQALCRSCNSKKGAS